MRSSDRESRDRGRTAQAVTQDGGRGDGGPCDAVSNQQATTERAWTSSQHSYALKHRGPRKCWRYQGGQLAGNPRQLASEAPGDGLRQPSCSYRQRVESGGRGREVIGPSTRRLVLARSNVRVRDSSPGGRGLLHTADAPRTIRM